MEPASQFELEEAKRFLAGLPEQSVEERRVGKYGGPFVESADLLEYDGPVEQDRLVNALKELGVEAQTVEELLALAAGLTQQIQNRTAQKQDEIKEIQSRIAVLNDEVAKNKIRIRSAKARIGAGFGIPHIVYLGFVLVIIAVIFNSMINKREPSQAEKSCEGLGGQISMDEKTCKFY